MTVMQPGFRYTKDQVRRFMTDEQARALQYRGYVLQVDGQGYYTLVHHTKAFGAKGATVLGRTKQGQMEGTLAKDDGVTGQASFEVPGAPKKRTPQERLESLTQKLWPTVKDVGHIPGLKDEDILPIVLNAQGRSLDQQRMTGETVKAVASEFLARAEKEHEEKLSHQITRHED